MLSKETLVQAAEAYFIDALKDYLGERHWVSLNEERALSAAKAACEQMSTEMDNCIYHLEVSDHCLHWLAEIKLTTDEGVETIEIPFNKVSPEGTHMMQPQMFLTALVLGAVGQAGEKKVTPAAILRVSKILEEIIERCRGCSACIQLQEAKFSGDKVLFCFSVSFYVTEDEQINLTYEIEWPQR